MGEAAEIGEHWNEEPPIGRLIRAHFGVEPGSLRTSAQSEPTGPKEVTEEEWKRICAEERAFSERSGGRSPFV